LPAPGGPISTILSGCFGRAVMSELSPSQIAIRMMSS
jgi:hypothetical protein